MIKLINKNLESLHIISTLATKEDQQIVVNLEDTLNAYKEECIGMAANMIGEYKRIIVCQLEPFAVSMVNPEILKKSGAYETEEGCLSLIGKRTTKRYKDITLKYLDRNFQEQKQNFSGLFAQIIQHEIDHCDGIII
ncbi:peptide deformylase [Liquorilactobacillus cacaonum]|uniref:Peptide deformylase n=1 Tax=Liquorilactobacillus cacaonum DSM 21116 TaxID=1423729 RepID=A0A0R2CVN0_9LACO|nr:peptide deformylase [Liquorilactobacillus cacaonum]KRM91980.1 peptide deformylase [Liquorilactobacillus cacaonum DSM 21116]